MNILDYFLKKSLPFRPKSMNELLALRIAQKLADTGAVEHYIRLLADYSIEQILAAYKRAAKSGDARVSALFHRELQTGNGRPAYSDEIRLIAIKVERRSIGAAVYDGNHLVYTDVRHLSSSPERAQSSSVGFVNWILANHEIQSAAIEVTPNGKNLRRTILTKTIHQCLLSPTSGFGQWQRKTSSKRLAIRQSRLVRNYDRRFSRCGRRCRMKAGRNNCWMLLPWAHSYKSSVCSSINSSLS